jgi:hypothetical protein
VACASPAVPAATMPFEREAGYIELLEQSTTTTTHHGMWRWICTSKGNVGVQTGKKALQRRANYFASSSLAQIYRASRNISFDGCGRVIGWCSFGFIMYIATGTVCWSFHCCGSSVSAAFRQLARGVCKLGAMHGLG